MTITKEAVIEGVSVGLMVMIIMFVASKLGFIDYTTFKIIALPIISGLITMIISDKNKK